jgi:hypothetical protein
MLCLILGQNLDNYQNGVDRDPASIPPRQTELEIEKIVPVKPVDQKITQETVALAIPTDIEQTSDSDKVQAKIVDHNVQNLLQGKYIKNNAVLQSAQKVQEAMKPSMSFGEEGGVQHNVNLELQPAQSVAKLNYSGFVETNVTYHTAEKSSEVSVSEQISSKAKLSLEHQSKEDLSMLKLNLDW